MKRLLPILLLPLLSLPAPAADAVEPATATITNLRGEAVATLPDTYCKGTTLRFTNCVAFAGTSTNSARQGLDSVIVELRLGTIASNVIYTGTVAVASNGTWWCDVTVPTNNLDLNLQIKLTDVATNTYIYPLKSISTRQPL